MKNTYIKTTLNTAIFSSAGFLVFFAIFNYFMPRAAAIGIAVTAAALLALPIIKLTLRSEQKRKESLALEKSAAELFVELCFLPHYELVAKFSKAYTALGIKTEKLGGALFLPEHNRTVFLRFGFDGLTKTDIVKVFNKIHTDGEAVIFANDCSAEVKSFVTRFGGKIRIAEKKEIYDLLKDGEAMPEIKHRLLPADERKKVALSSFLDRKKAKRFLAVGLTFLFFSFFVPLKIYYIVCGSLLCLFALTVIFFVKPAR